MHATHALLPSRSSSSPIKAKSRGCARQMRISEYIMIRILSKDRQINHWMHILDSNKSVAAEILLMKRNANVKCNLFTNQVIVKLNKQNAGIAVWGIPMRYRHYLSLTLSPILRHRSVFVTPYYSIILLPYSYSVACMWKYVVIKVGLLMKKRIFFRENDVFQLRNNNKIQDTSKIFEEA